MWFGGSWGWVVVVSLAAFVVFCWLVLLVVGLLVRLLVAGLSIVVMSGWLWLVAGNVSCF